MSRQLQHIASVADVEDAKREGRKVGALCGAKNYPMTEMGDHIPTCSRCASALVILHAAVTDELADIEGRLAVFPVSITYSTAGKTKWRWSR